MWENWAFRDLEPDWFDVKSHPQARFEATGFRTKGGDNYEARGINGTLKRLFIARSCVPATNTVSRCLRIPASGA
jgi:hypothetical protein